MQNSEFEIEEIQGKIRKLKSISETAKQMTVEIGQMCEASGVFVESGWYADLHRVERTIQTHLTSLRLQIAKLRGE